MAAVNGLEVLGPDTAAAAGRRGEGQVQEEKWRQVMFRSERQGRKRVCHARLSGREDNLKKVVGKRI